MQVLIIGSGGREHAIAWKVAQSTNVDKVYVAPGNAGCAGEPKVETLDISADDTETLLDFAQQKKIGLTIVGPEAPLVSGLVDEFRAAGLRVFGPSAKAAQLEGSKAFSKAFLQRNQIPTAKHAVFTEVDAAVDYIESGEIPIVIKADGLAAGKGVVVASTRKDAIKAVHEMLENNQFGDAGHKVVIEDFLHGEEASFICIVDGQQALAMASSQDHKARDDGDSGPNTGGMGAYSPAPVVTDAVHQHIMSDIIEPTVSAMHREGHPFVGFLYAGLMIDDLGKAKVIEFNVRLGDPEAQPLLMRLNTDLVDLCNAAIDGQLASTPINWKPHHAIGVVMAAGGYPGSYNQGDVIAGLDSITDPDCKVFHAGTKNQNGQIITAGGRVLCVTALGDTIEAAHQRAYDGVAKISWDGVFNRSDIAHRALSRSK